MKTKRNARIATERGLTAKADFACALRVSWPFLTRSRRCLGMRSANHLRQTGKMVRHNIVANMQFAPREGTNSMCIVISGKKKKQPTNSNHAVYLELMG